MRSRLLAVTLMSLPLFAACAGGEDEGPTPYDDDFPVSRGQRQRRRARQQLAPRRQQGRRGLPGEVRDRATSRRSRARAAAACARSSRRPRWSRTSTSRPACRSPRPTSPSSTCSGPRRSSRTAFPQHRRLERRTRTSQTVVKFGTIKEADWRYESAPWTAANDPECGERREPADQVLHERRAAGRRSRRPRSSSCPRSAGSTPTRSRRTSPPRRPASTSA